MTTDLLLIGHGSRDPAAAKEFGELVDLVAARLEGPRVAGGFLELSEPAIDDALDQVNNTRATFGATQSRFDAVIANLQQAVENQAAARSRIMDADFAAETANLSRAQILQQAGTAVDLRTLQAQLEQQAALDAVGGLAYLAGLDVDLPDIGRIDSYVEIVKERSLRRRLIQACSQVTRACLDGGVSDLQ